MEDEMDLGKSLASNLDQSLNGSTSLSKSDVMSGNQMIDNWCKFQLTIFSKLLFRYIFVERIINENLLIFD